MNKDKIYILGPCAMENEELFYKTLAQLDKIMRGYNWFYKTSFDKANRTSVNGKRGIGLEKALELWKEAKRNFSGIRFTTDVHEVWQVEKLVEVIDVIQVPAFLSRQTDLVVECARHFNKVNIKKGQWLGPNNLIVSVDKIKKTNPNCEAWITDRGSNFGYHDLFVNFGIVDELKQYYDKVILDATHSTQRSRSVYGTQGDRELAKRYFLSVDVFGYDGVFAETHPEPEKAHSDGDCQLFLKDIPDLVEKKEKIRKINEE